MSALNPSDLEEDARHGVTDELFGPDQLYMPQSDTTELFGNDSVSMVSQDAFENNKLATKPGTEKSDSTNMTVDNILVLNSEVNSPRETVSPTASSPFSAMESDGEGIETGQDEANLSCAGDQSFNRINGYYGASTPLNTTTPCASSSCCDDEYESMGSRKKRRKTRRDMHHVHPGLSVVSVSKQPNNDWPQDNETSPFSPPTCPKGMNFAFGTKSIKPSGGMISNPQEDDYDEFPPGNAKRTRKCMELVDDEMNMNIKTEAPNNMDSAMALVQTTPVTKRGANPLGQVTVTTEDEQMLHSQYPRKSGSYELHIITQPEPQHRARYLTEGSRGPVKDATQTGFPKVQLLGYTKPVILQVFVATDSGKIKPHGFYQACRVTGRNTSPCEEIEIQGTKVIEIPFKQEDGSMVLNIDCVGILKLRNTDVEVRTGLRNQKRNQSVRLVFRVAFKPTASNGPQIVLQAASSRISCTQPLGQPEITKKSIDRCSVEGGTEMFIIGKNFHRGTKVIYQDPEEPDGKQWTAEGEIEKDTFHQYHMVVRVPPYHDQTIVKPVNVQLIVEFQDKKCEPHSFTYTPKPKEPEPAKEEMKQPAAAVPAAKIETALNILDGPIDKKFLVALFSKLLSENVSNQGGSLSGTNTPIKGDAANSNSAINTHSLISAVLQNQAGSAPIQSMKDASQPCNPSPVSPPSTLFAAISVQNPQPVFAKSLTNNVPLQTQVVQAFVRSNAAGNVSSPVANISATAINPPTFIKSETISAEAEAFQLSKSQPTSLAIGNLPSVAITMTDAVASPNMVVSPLSGQTFQTGVPQPVCYNSFTTSHPAIGTLITSAPGLVVSATHQPPVSQLNAIQVESAIANQVVKVPNNDGFLQSAGTMTTVSVGSNNNASTFPVTNFQVGQTQQQQQSQQNMLTNVTSMAVPQLLAVHPTPAVADMRHAQFSQGSTSINLQNSQGLVRSNVLQQPTFTFQQNANIVTTATIQNPQITNKPVTTSQGIGANQVQFGEQMQLTLGTDGGQGIQQRSIAVKQPVVISQNQQSYAIFTDGVHQQAAAISIAVEDKQNQPSSYANSLSHNINQASFIVQPQNHPVFHQQQQFNTAQVQSTNSLPNVFQGNNVFPQQFSQIPTDKNPGSNQVQIQTLPGGSHSDEKQMQVDSFPTVQNPNQVCHATVSPIDAMSVQTAVPAVNNVLTQKFSNSQVTSVMIEDHQMSEVVPNGNQTQLFAINVAPQQHVSMAAEPSPPSATETSPQTVTDNNQQMPPGYGINTGISSQTYQTPQPAETPMIHETTADQPMELGQSNLTSAQGNTNFHMQQQPQQNSNASLGHDSTIGAQSYQAGFSSLQQQVTPGQTFQAANISGVVSSGDVEIAGHNGSLQQPVQPTNNVTNFQSSPFVNDNTAATFNPQNFQAMQQKPVHIGDVGQTFQDTTLGNVHNTSALGNFPQSLQQPNPSVIANDDNSGNVESHALQGLQQAQNISIPVAQNFQASPINFNAVSTVLDQQNLQSTRQANATPQSMIIVKSFQPQNVSVAAPPSENVAVTFVMSDQQYQASNQSTQNSQSGVSTGTVNAQSQNFVETSTKSHAVNNHPQVNTSFPYDGNNSLGLPQGSHGNLQNPALHQLGQLQPQLSCQTNTVNRPLESHSPDIYAMHEVLRSINGEQELAAISGEDVQRHCQ